MKPRYIASKLFFGLAVAFALMGTVLFRRGTIGSGLTAGDYFNPLFWITIPRFVPFAAAVLSAFFCVVYYALEKKSQRPANTTLTLVHLVSYLLAILGHTILLRFWWSALGDARTSVPLPLWAGSFAILGSALCCLAFGANVYRGVSQTRRMQTI